MSKDDIKIATEKVNNYVQVNYLFDQLFFNV